MRIIAIIFLGLIAFFFGGCAIAFIGDPYGDPTLIVIGFGISALAIWGIVGLVRRARTAASADKNGSE